MEQDQTVEPIVHTDEVLLTLDEAVKFLDTSKSTLYRLLSLQDIKGVKVGKQWRFRKADLTAYIERSPVAVAVDACARADLDSELGFFDLELAKAGVLNPEIGIWKIADREWYTTGTSKSKGADESGSGTPESKINDLAGRILRLAFTRGASDIHLEPMGATLRLRLRIDGVLHDVRQLPASLQDSVITRFKEMCHMNLIERRLPQDGRVGIRTESVEYDIRMSLMPTLFGENAVMRILNRTQILIGLDRLGMSAADRETLRTRLHRSSGLVLVTGPTGSGKTTLLYSCLGEIATDALKAITIEDPIEFALPGVTQVQTNLRSGVTFAVGMRSALRQDPDVILCGEIPDLETAQLVARSALTGHLVATTLHAEDAPGAVLRLLGIGLEPHVISATLKCVVATRLARRLCPHCKEPNDSDRYDDLIARAREASAKGGYELPSDVVFFSPKGCDQCNQTGFRGRIGLFEVLPCDHQHLSQLLGSKSEDEAAELAVRSGMRSLFAGGMCRAVEGETSVEEVFRATGNWM